jgi:hypothetical protein
VTRSLPLLGDSPCAQCAKQAVADGRRGNGQGSITASWGPMRAEGTRAVRHHIALRVRGKLERETANISHAEAVRRLKVLQDTVAQVGTPASRTATVGDLVRQYLDMAAVKDRRGTHESYSTVCTSRRQRWPASVSPD